ncbi:MAG: glycosyltransferase family 39 protein [Anaerolineae bacterium]
MNKISLLLVLVAFVAMSLAWNVLVPAYENLDEIEHTEVIRHVAVTQRLPVHGEAEEAGFRVRQEASQPPLYYLIGAIWVKVLDLPLDPPEREPVPGAVVACGPSDTFYNKATWARDPYIGFPWSGHVRTVHGLRLLSMFLQIFTVVGTWVLGRLLFPRGPVPLVATLIVAFNPQFLLVASGVNNDNLVTPLVTWALVLLIHIWQEGPTTARLLGLGALTGLSGLSKLSGLALLGLGGLVLIVYTWREGRPFLDLVRWGLLLVLPALILMAPWILHNIRVYGDPTALSPMFEKVGRRTPGSVRLLAEAGLMWRSYWGQVPCSFYPRAFYWPFTLLVVGGVLGVTLNLRRFLPFQRQGFVILAGWFVVVVAAWVRWNLLTPAPGGRLLFPASPAVALVVAAGWVMLSTRLGRPSRATSFIPLLWGAFLPLWALVALRVGPVTLFAPPRRLPPEVTPPNAVDFVFGDAISLKGYEVHLERPRWYCWLASRSYCRPSLGLTLYWQALHPPDEDWVMAVQLVSTAPGENDLRLSYDRWPGRGNLPTSALPVGTVIKDRYLWPLPEGDFTTQGWDLEISFVEPGGGVRLPITTVSGDVANTARLTTLRVPGEAPACPEVGDLPSSVRFAEAIELTHAEVRPAEEGRRVLLCWESLEPLTEDYTIFVHAYGEEGALMGTGDGPPMNQAFPTHLWEPGDRIADEHVIPLQAGMEPARIAVGLYHPETGTRLPATMDGQPLPDGAFMVWRAER